MASKKLKNNLSYGVQCVSISAIYAWNTSVTDRQTDRQTENLALEIVCNDLQL